MADRLKGKTALLTAAGAGIGRATAIAFAKEGARVIATDLKPELIADLKSFGIAETLPLNVLSTEAVQQLEKQIGGIDVLFNCAGYVAHGTVLECSDADWDFSFDINVKSMHRMIHTFLPGMIARGGGSIVNISSGASSLKAAANRYVYGTTKAAVIGLTKAVALDHIRQGIRCNAICPGTVQSPSLDARIEALAASSNKPVVEVRDMFIGRQPMGRLGTAEEIAMLALYLASDESSFTTGAVHSVDGGWTL